jgi:aminoglycoside/choline kinase family phosphotransferase
MSISTPNFDEVKRTAEIRAFVDATEWAGAIVQPLQMDSSERRFMRVEKNGKSAIVMDARPPKENVEDFRFIRDKFAAIGLSVPEIYEIDQTHSLLMMEDYGDERFYETVLQETQDIDHIYALVTDALVHKSRADPAVALAESIPYGHEYWMPRVSMFIDDYCVNEGIQLEQSARDQYSAVFHTLIARLYHFPPEVLLGDCGAQNLFPLPKREGIKATGFIDFQDATKARGNMSGSPAFDLVFLLQDVRLPFPEGLEGRMKQRYIEKSGIANIDAFNEEYAIIGAAQASKCIGLFSRLGKNRSEYLEFIPKCWANLEQNMTHPALKDLKQWFDANISMEQRHGINVAVNFSLPPAMTGP